MSLENEIEPFADALENMADNLIALALDRSIVPKSLEHTIRNIANSIASNAEELREI